MPAHPRRTHNRAPRFAFNFAGACAPLVSFAWASSRATAAESLAGCSVRERRGRRWKVSTNQKRRRRQRQPGTRASAGVSSLHPLGGSQPRQQLPWCPNFQSKLSHRRRAVEADHRVAAATRHRFAGPPSSSPPAATPTTQSASCSCSPCTTDDAWRSSPSGSQPGEAAAAPGMSEAVLPVPTKGACRVPGCTQRLLQPYNQRHRICRLHQKAAAIEFEGLQWRFCQQVGADQRNCRPCVCPLPVLLQTAVSQGNPAPHITAFLT